MLFATIFVSDTSGNPESAFFHDFAMHGLARLVSESTIVLAFPGNLCGTQLSVEFLNAFSKKIDVF